MNSIDKVFVSELTDQTILCGFSINNEWISKDTGDDRHKEFDKRVRFVFPKIEIITNSENLICKGCNSEVSADEAIFAALRKVSHVEILLVADREWSNHLEVIIGPIEVMYLFFRFRNEVGSQGEYQRINLRQGADSNELKVLEDRWENLLTYKRIPDSVSSINEGGPSSKNPSKTIFYLKYFLMGFIVIFGFGVIAYIFWMKKPIYMIKKSQRSRKKILGLVEKK